VVGNYANEYNGDGVLATSAQLRFPVGVAVDGGGNLYLAANALVRKVAAGTGVIRTVVGQYPSNGSTADGITATDAISRRQSMPVSLRVTGSPWIRVATYMSRKRPECARSRRRPG
jgi:hypothetical protein